MKLNFVFFVLLSDSALADNIRISVSVLFLGEPPLFFYSS